MRMTLSPSQVNSYLECPYQWYCSSVLKLPEPVTTALAIGRAVHTAAAELLALKRSGEAPTAEQIADASTAASALHLDTVDGPEPRDEDEANEAAADRYETESLIESLVTLWWQAAAPSIQPAQIEQAITGHIGGVPVNAIIDIVTTDGTVIDIKTASKRPNGITPPQRIQVTTYAMLSAPANESHTVRLDVLTKTKTPAYVRLQTGLQEDDYRYAERIYPMAAEAMEAGIYLPHRSGNLCSRRYCAHWQTCEIEFGGTVRAS